MKQNKSIAGVTLLEIMLVLAIASMVIVMSIRYYQNATNASNTNIIFQQIQNITAAADNLAQGKDYTESTSASITALVGSSNMKTPYGSTILISDPLATKYTVTIPGIPESVCTSLKAKLKANLKFTNVSACTVSGTTSTLAYTYDASI